VFTLAIRNTIVNGPFANALTDTSLLIKIKQNMGTYPKLISTTPSLWGNVPRRCSMCAHRLQRPVAQPNYTTAPQFCCLRVELRLLILSVRTHKHRENYWKGSSTIHIVQCKVGPSEKRRFVLADYTVCSTNLALLRWRVWGARTTEILHFPAECHLIIIHK
jgi:hypothetical protein